MPMQRTMRTVTSKLILPLAVLALWALLGEASRAKAGYASSVALCASRITTPSADALTDGAAPTETGCSMTAGPATVPVDDSDPRFANSDSVWRFLAALFATSPVHDAAGRGTGRTGVTWWDRPPRQQAAPLSSPTGSPPPAKHSSVVSEHDDSPPDGLVCLPFRPPRLV